MGSGASSRSDAQVGALTIVQPEGLRLPRKKCKIKWGRRLGCSLKVADNINLICSWGAYIYETIYYTY